MLRLFSFLACLLLLTISLGVPSALAVNKGLSLDGAGDYVDVGGDESQFDIANSNITDDEINSGNLVGYWNFDDGTADDLSPYGNHGTLMGDAEIVDSDAPIVYTGSINGHVTDLGGKPLWALVITINSETKEKAVDITEVDGYYEKLR